ncbi:MAG: type I phosphomannose isomerase catalytic subunit [Planctomycetota bacterium]|jgi:mannose-6-phosphate isomerase
MNSLQLCLSEPIWQSMFTPDHPLRFAPLFRSYLWGGQRLAAQLGKKLPDEGIWAESWEIVDHREGESVVCEGAFAGLTLRQLIEEHPHAMLGPAATPAEGRDRFPLLLKYLDCQRDLSVQVHPDDVYGARMTLPDRGKTEAWYVLEADPGAVVYAGLKEGVTRSDLELAIAQGATERCLHQLHPKTGDCIFIPAGTVHALGAGLIVAEIQQSSDCTFRLYDWNRLDANGSPRPLHIAQALEVIDFDRGPVSIATPRGTDTAGQSILVDCDRFQLLECKGPGRFPLPATTFSIVTLPAGTGTIETSREHHRLSRGESLLIPSACVDAVLHLETGSVALVAIPPSDSCGGDH